MVGVLDEQGIGYFRSAHLEGDPAVGTLREGAHLFKGRAVHVAGGIHEAFLVLPDEAAEPVRGHDLGDPLALAGSELLDEVAGAGNRARRP